MSITASNLPCSLHGVLISDSRNDMRVTYKMTIDSSYCRTIVERYYRQRPFLLRLEVQFALMLIPIGCWWLYARVSAVPEFNTKAVGTWLVVWVFVAIAGVLITKWVILRRMKKKMEYGTEVTMILSGDGIEATGQHVSSKWSWAAYPRAVRFPDGILLQRDGVIRWLPDSAIQEGTAEQVSELVAAKTDFRRVA